MQRRTLHPNSLGDASPVEARRWWMPGYWGCLVSELAGQALIAVWEDRAVSSAARSSQTAIKLVRGGEQSICCAHRPSEVIPAASDRSPRAALTTDSSSKLNGIASWPFVFHVLDPDLGFLSLLIRRHERLGSTTIGSTLSPRRRLARQAAPATVALGVGSASKPAGRR